MTKTDDLIQKYKDVYHDLNGVYPKVNRKGSWIYINESPTAFRSSQLTEMIGNLLKRKFEVKEPEPEPDDIRELVSAIRQDGRNIFRSHDIKEMQRVGNRIAKTAKRVLNILDEGEL